MLTHVIRCPLAVWCWSMLGLKASPPLFLLFLPSSVQASDIYAIYFYLNIYGSSIFFFEIGLTRPKLQSHMFLR